MILLTKKVPKKIKIKYLVENLIQKLKYLMKREITMKELHLKNKEIFKYRQAVKDTCLIEQAQAKKARIKRIENMISNTLL